MRSTKRIPRQRSKPRVIHPERSGGHKRERLYGKARERRRADIFERAGGRCEDTIHTIAFGEGCMVDVRCTNRATEWSNMRHGANKCDCMECGIASCHECHVKRHNSNGKPCPSKPRMERTA